MSNFHEKFNIGFNGFVKVLDPDTNEVINTGNNAINYGNMSVVIASLLGGVDITGSNPFSIDTMIFGNGAIMVDGTGAITYRPPVVDIGSASELYNKTYEKYIGNSVGDDAENNIVVQHDVGTNFTDIIVTCTLNKNEPNSSAEFGEQDAIDNATSLSSPYMFNEFALVTQSGLMLTHYIHSPIQKAANRRLQIIYTIRITTG